MRCTTSPVTGNRRVGSSCTSAIYPAGLTRYLRFDARVGIQAAGHGPASGFRERDGIRSVGEHQVSATE